MQVRNLLFKYHEARALKEGRKTQKRLPLPDWQIPRAHDDGSFFAVAQHDSRYGFGVSGQTEADCIRQLIKYGCCPFGKIGDLIYVREPYITGYDTNNGLPIMVDSQGNDLPAKVWYKADGDLHDWFDEWEDIVNVPWKSSSQMPRSLSRLTLKITDIRIERVQDISEQDATSEGIRCYQFYPRDGYPPYIGYTHLQEDDGRSRLYANSVEAFENLWKLIYGESWSRNDWVWVLEFEVIKENVDAYLAKLAA